MRANEYILAYMTVRDYILARSVTEFLIPLVFGLIIIGVLLFWNWVRKPKEGDGDE